jgi:hypothetical protein
MTIQFRCPDCAEPFNVGADLAGRKSRCTCGLVITIPQPAVPIQPQPQDPLMGPLPQGLPTANPLAGSVSTGISSAKSARDTGDYESYMDFLLWLITAHCLYVSGVVE